jgi:hypothetical protein
LEHITFAGLLTNVKSCTFAYLGCFRSSIDSHFAHHQHHAKSDSTIFIWEMDPVQNRVKQTLRFT